MDEPRLRVRVPADVELEDRLAFGLTARQLMLLAVTVVIAYAIFAVAKLALPAPVAVALATPVALVGVLLAVGRLEGLTADRLALVALRFAHTPRRRVLGGSVAAALPGVPRQIRLAPLDLPVRSVLRSGLVELADGRHCLIAHATAAGFALRSGEEQAALVEAFGRFLNALVDPIEIVIRAEPLHLAPLLTDLEQTADRLIPAALAAAAEEHGRFLAELAGREGVRRREVLLVLSTSTSERQAARALLERRAGEAQELLRPAGVELQPLDGAAAATLLARALGPSDHRSDLPAAVTLDGVIGAC